VIVLGVSIIAWTYFDSSTLSLENPKRVPIQVTSLEFHTGNLNNPTTIQFNFDFETDYEFAATYPFNYVFQAKIGGPEIIDEIWILFDTPNVDSTKINAENVKAILAYAKEKSFAVKLEKIGSTKDLKTLYERKGSFMYPIETNVVLFPITIGKNGEYGPLKPNIISN
jgi:hypothetical protein